MWHWKVTAERVTGKSVFLNPLKGGLAATLPSPYVSDNARICVCMGKIYGLQSNIELNAL